MTKPEILSKNGTSIFISFSSFGFDTVSPFGNMGIDLFKKLKQHSHEYITPSNSNAFWIPKTISIFSCISDIKCIFQICDYVYLLLLEWKKSMLKYCPLPTWVLCVFDVNLGNEWSDLQHK